MSSEDRLLESIAGVNFVAHQGGEKDLSPLSQAFIAAATDAQLEEVKLIVRVVKAARVAVHTQSVPYELQAAVWALNKMDKEFDES